MKGIVGLFLPVFVLSFAFAIFAQEIDTERIKTQKITFPPGTDVSKLLDLRHDGSQTSTKINNTAAARMLLGKHRLSLQWVSWNYFGTATVTNNKGIYRIKGEQKGRGNTDFVRIDGAITSIDAKEFKFDGTIITQVSHINGGQPCKREGEFTFRITRKRKYWRLMEMDDPCDPVTDYVDIYFR